MTAIDLQKQRRMAQRLGTTLEPGVMDMFDELGMIPEIYFCCLLGYSIQLLRIVVLL